MNDFVEKNKDKVYSKQDKIDVFNKFWDEFIDK